MLTSSHLFITLVNGLLLTRIEHNCASSSLASCKDVIIYNHGFPDSSVVPTAKTDFDAAGSTPEHGSFPVACRANGASMCCSNWTTPLS